MDGQPAELGRPGLNRLDQPVFFPGDRGKSVAEQVNGLVVMGGHVEELTRRLDAGQQ